MVLLSVRKTAFLLAVAVFLAGTALAADEVFPPLVNWTAPATFSSHSASRGASTMGDISGALPFVAVTPCRQYDSRNFTPLPNNTSRAVVLTGAPCGLPTSASAVSVNITIFSISATANGVFQVGTATAPTFAWINFPPTETQRGNAGALPVDFAGQLWVRVQMGSGQLDFTVDVNGYYPNYSINPGETFGIVANSSGLGVIFGENDSTSGFATSGVRGVVTGTGAGAAGVLGESRSTSASANGVRGITSSDASNAAGILGTTAYTFPLGFSTSGAGVRGQGRNGVVGATSQTTGNVGEGGVIGIVSPNGGGLGAYGYLGYAPTNKGVFSVGDMATTGAKPFMDPHPTDPTKMIEYIALEGNESGTYFRGTARTDQGTAIIDVPEDFRLVTDSEGLSVQLTPVGAPATMYVVSEDLNQIVVHSNRDVKFHYMVNGIRLAFKDHKVIQDSFGTFVPPNPEMTMSSAFAPEQKRRLIANGTFHPDGTVNLETAKAVGWDKIWQQRTVKTDQPAPANNKPD